MKKVLASFLAFVIIFSSIPQVFAESTTQSQYNEAGKVLQGLGLLKGDEKGDLGLSSNLLKQHMVVMISRLYGESEEAGKFVGVNKFKDLQPKHYQDIPFITWAANKGLIKGKPNGNFGIDEDVTIQEYQTVLLRSLGYEEDAKDWDMIPSLANAYGLMKNLDVKSSSKMSRGVMAIMTVNALRQQKNGESITLADFLNVEMPETFKIDSDITIENNSITFKGKAIGSENLWISLKPISSNITMKEKLMPVPMDSKGNFSYEVKDLEIGEYQYRYQSGQNQTEYKSFKINVLPFNLTGVTATNLKEIHLTFTQAVDKTITSLNSNYTTTAGPIKDIRFEDNDKKIIITLQGTMTQQVKYKISAMKIKSNLGEEIPLKDYVFDAFDNILPKVDDIKQLGDKGIRVYFSEPIKKAVTTDFKVDGKSFNGSAKLENNIVTLLYFSSAYALGDGNHTLMISTLEDFAGLKPDESNYNFVISKDTTAPKIVSASATLERVTIEFDEDIDPISVQDRSIYWKVGSNKIYSNSITVKGNKIIAGFKNPLSTNNNTIYVENIADYSGNKTNSSVDVVPVIDATNPEVISYAISKDGKTITVYYSKNVIGTNKKDYTILDEKGKTVNIRDVQGSGTEYKVNLYSALPVGKNIFTIEGVQDTTTIKNTVIPFRTEIQMNDIESPRLTNSTGYANNIMLYFSKVMDITTITNPDNYIMVFKGKQEKLPTNSLFTTSNDGKSVSILLPESYDGNKVMVGSIDNLTNLDIRGLKDIVGNSTDPLILNVKFDGTSTGKAKPIDYYSERPGRQGVLLESNLIKVRFNLPIVQASEKDFKVEGRTVSSVTVDGTDEVTIYLEDKDATSIPQGALSIIENNNMKTAIDTGVEKSTILLYDAIAPRIKNDTSYLLVTGSQIEIPFTEILEDEGASLYRRDLEVIRLYDNKLLSEDSYTTSLKSSDKSIVVLNINKRDITSGYSVRLHGEYNKDTLSYIRDKDGNLALQSEPYFTSIDIPKQ